MPKRGREWTMAELNRGAALISQEGMSAVEAAKVLGRSYWSVVQALEQRGGVKALRRVWRTTMRRRCVELIRGGLSYAEVAKVLGVTRSFVQRAATASNVDGYAERRRRFQDRDWSRERRWAVRWLEGESWREIAEGEPVSWGAVHAAVQRWKRAHDIPLIRAPGVEREVRRRLQRQRREAERACAVAGA